METLCTCAGAAAGEIATGSAHRGGRATCYSRHPQADAHSPLGLHMAGENGMEGGRRGEDRQAYKSIFALLLSPTFHAFPSTTSNKKMLIAVFPPQLCSYSSKKGPIIMLLASTYILCQSSWTSSNIKVGIRRR